MVVGRDTDDVRLSNTIISDDLKDVLESPACKGFHFGGFRFPYPEIHIKTTPPPMSASRPISPVLERPNGNAHLR
ncbi:hypothetical protein BBOMB_0082 [Bifidobacterium bombi DSM 19703]|uniref:Uncharacterized protein n=1 Tax=Bifidobacterium bombi DSM 19703 TaxID=1341695 RepID=A0A080N5L6_9BIFI|nr:hypothetical protein BBOMB_0082 [Bifidobacterium bombi DSM 19703]